MKKTSKPKTPGKSTPSKRSRSDAPARTPSPEGVARPSKVRNKAVKSNPFRPSTSYAACFAALRKLGVGRAHNFDTIVAEIKRQMGTEAFAVFSIKPARNGSACTSPEARLLQNVQVISRKDKYGEPVRGAGYNVVWDGRKRMAGLFRH